MNTRFIKGVWIDWKRIDEDSYLRAIPALQFTEELPFRKDVVFFNGENGTGKSTLLEGIAAAYGFNPEGGTKNYRFSTYDSHSELYQAIRLSKGVNIPAHGYFLKAESFYNVESKMEEYMRPEDYEKIGGRSLHEQSHGEAFLSLIQGMFIGRGLYILDEPEAALSPQRQLTLLMEIDRLRKQRTQFIIASHSPILLGLPDAQIFRFEESGIKECGYKDTESYQVMEMFINHREYLLKKLLEYEG